MQGLALFLFILGALFIYCGWKAGGQQNKELYTALLALSKIKQKVSQLEKDYQVLAAKVERHHLWQAEVEGFKEELNSLKQALDRQVGQAIPDAQPLPGEKAQAARPLTGEKAPATAPSPDAPVAATLLKEETARGRENNVYSIEWFRGQGAVQSETVKEAPRENISDKYRKAIVLAQSGMSVSQVAEELDISQDAVNMVLRTYQIGGRR